VGFGAPRQIVNDYTYRPPNEVSATSRSGVSGLAARLGLRMSAGFVSLRHIVNDYTYSRSHKDSTTSR
jgi:hypothetical protein